MQKLIVGNLKMNMENVSQRDTYCKEFSEELAKLQTKHVIVICPPVIYLEYFCRTLDHKKVAIGTQDCFWELYGSYTGNTSPKSIASLGAKYVILGHSEHREFSHETDEDIAKKIKMALRVELIPIVCVGFLSVDDEMNSIRMQVESVINNCDEKMIEKIVFVYEPVWAIGTGKTPKSDDIHTVVMFMRSMLVYAYGKEITNRVKILYGGSVIAENVTEVCVQSYTDGVLVGRASLSPENFLRIVRMLS